MKYEIKQGIYKSYGRTNKWLKDAFEKYPITGHPVLVFGSVSPFYESFVLEYNGHPVTVEYNPRISVHSELSFYTPDQWEKYGFPVDSALSISSFEHDGLGRYGDPVNPEGNLNTMKQLLKSKFFKPGGLLYLSVPIGIDAVVYNAHRIYRYHRLPLLLSGWKILDVFNDLNEKLFEVDERGTIKIDSSKWNKHFKLGEYSGEEWVFVLQK